MYMAESHTHSTYFRSQKSNLSFLFITFSWDADEESGFHTCLSIIRIHSTKK